MSEFKASGFRDEFGSGGPDLVGITTMTSPYYFVPPSGSTAERPSSPPPGMLRFNTDIGRLEVWRNDHWATILGESPNLGDQLIIQTLLVEQELVDYSHQNYHQLIQMLYILQLKLLEIHKILVI